jgi:CheY-like chemotaxis protein
MPETALILIAEDDEEQVALIRRAFKKANLVNPLHVVSNGDEVLSYLKGDGQYARRAEYPLPALLLLDLKMPRKNGFEVLQWVRQQPGLRALRVIVLTNSEDLRDVNRAYQLGANSFLIKPVDFERFVAVIQALQGYWLWMSEAPTIDRRPAPQNFSDGSAQK